MWKAQFTRKIATEIFCQKNCKPAFGCLERISMKFAGLSSARDSVSSAGFKLDVHFTSFSRIKTVGMSTLFDC